MKRWRLTRNLLPSPGPATWLALLLPVFAWAQLAFPGYFEVHAGFLPIFNLNDLLRHLGEPGWTPSVGRPFDLIRGEGALPYLLAVVPRVFGVQAVTSVKLVYGASIMAGALGMYLWSRRRFGPLPALVSSTAYALWPLGLAAVYVRGAFAEAAFIGLQPWVLWAAERTATARRWHAAIPLSFLLATVMWTQLGLALWLVPITWLFMLVLAEGSGSLSITLRVLATILAGTLLGLAGLIPAMARHSPIGSTYVLFSEHFVYPHQLMLAGWGFGPSLPGPDDTLTFQLGLVVCGLALFGCWGYRTANRAPGASVGGLSPSFTGRIVVFAACVVAILALLSTTLSGSFWQLLPSLTHTLTYPWQLLLLAGPWLAWLAGLGVWCLMQMLDDKSLSVGRMPLIAGLIALVVLGSYSFLNPKAISDPVPDMPLAIFGQGEIALLSATVSGAPGPGRPVTATVRWQALRPPDEDYTVFFHAVDPGGTLQGQWDTMPRDNTYPTSQWTPGEVVTDRYRLTLEADAPASDAYTFPLGLYLLRTGQRLTAGSDDKVVLTP